MKRTIWQGLLMLVGVGGLVFGALRFSNARNAVHEIEALICLLIGVAGVGFAATIAALEAVRGALIDQTKASAMAASNMPQTTAEGPR
jgi:hypothetical protein